MLLTVLISKHPYFLNLERSENVLLFQSLWKLYFNLLINLSFSIYLTIFIVKDNEVPRVLMMSILIFSSFFLFSIFATFAFDCGKFFNAFIFVTIFHWVLYAPLRNIYYNDFTKAIRGKPYLIEKVVIHNHCHDILKP